MCLLYSDPDYCMESTLDQHNSIYKLSMIQHWAWCTLFWITEKLPQELQSESWFVSLHIAILKCLKMLEQGLFLSARQHYYDNVTKFWKIDPNFVIFYAAILKQYYFVRRFVGFIARNTLEIYMLVWKYICLWFGSIFPIASHTIIV